MTAPLMMIGPGGDYVTRFDVKGEGLVKTRTQQSAGHDRDNASNGGSAWGFLSGRRKNKNAKAKANRPADRFEHTHPAARPATYAKPGQADLHQQLAMIQAIERWLTGQQDELDRLAAIQTATEADLVRVRTQARSATGPASAQSAPVRVIRFNSTTLALPTPAPDCSATRGPEPCHAFATHETTQDNTTPNPNPTQRSVKDDQPQPHAQANENFDINSRHPAIARLFADDERARRSARGLQGHHLRTRRGADQKGLPGQGCEQGALFGAVA